MSERLPYEEQLPHQWDALPLPDESLAWADMKRRLEEDDDRTPLAWWRRGCMLWGFLLLALLGTGWWLFRPDKWYEKKKDTDSIAQVKKNSDTSLTDRIRVDTITVDLPKKNESTPEQVIDQSTVADSIAPNTNSKTVVPGQGKKEAGGELKTRTEKNTRKINPEKGTKGPGKKNNPPPVKDPKGEKGDITGNTDRDVKDVVIDKKDNLPPVDNNSTRPDTLIAATKKDMVKKIDVRTDSAVVSKTAKKDSLKKKNPLFFSAGIAMHQQLPVAGQKLTPYNALGRKGSLADYIPSVYFRLNKKDKWFLQAEFRYGAPQYNKEFMYDQQSLIDTGQNPVFTTITSTQLKKTFYHQLPVTFHYYIAKNWSLGGGIQWNNFSGAIGEQEINKRRNANSQDSIISKTILAQKGDSAYQFTKSYFLGVVETEYKWKRFSAGARYTFGLQPYIKFSLPGGPVQQQRSTSLQVFLRYQLWRSKE